MDDTDNIENNENIINLIKNVGKEVMHNKKIFENITNQDFVTEQMSKIQNLRDDMQNIQKFIAGELSQINPSQEFLNFVDEILTINKQKISSILSITGYIKTKIPRILSK